MRGYAVHSLVRSCTIHNLGISFPSINHDIGDLWRIIEKARAKKSAKMKILALLLKDERKEKCKFRESRQKS